jgi:hypothetical protein
VSTVLTFPGRKEGQSASGLDTGGSSVLLYRRKQTVSVAKQCLFTFKIIHELNSLRDKNAEFLNVKAVDNCSYPWNLWVYAAEKKKNRIYK